MFSVSVDFTLTYDKFKNKIYNCLVVGRKGISLKHTITSQAS